MVYFSTYANPLYSTSDLRQILHTTHPHPTYGFTDTIWTIVAPVPGPLVLAQPPSLSYATVLGPKIVLTLPIHPQIIQ